MLLYNCGIIDPECIDEAIANGGYLAIAKVLSGMTQDDVINEITASDYVGVVAQASRPAENGALPRLRSVMKIFICNADEGDPVHSWIVHFRRRPHGILEGMLIGGYAIGADTGIIYIRAEYPLAVHRLETAIVQARNMDF